MSTKSSARKRKQDSENNKPVKKVAVSSSAENASRTTTNSAARIPVKLKKTSNVNVFVPVPPNLFPQAGNGLPALSSPYQ